MSEEQIGIVVKGKRYLTVNQAAGLLHISRRTVYNWIALGKIKSACAPGGGRYIEYDSLKMTPEPADSIQVSY